MARRAKVKSGQKTVSGNEAQQPTLYRMRPQPAEEYEELSDEAISRIYNHLRQYHWETLKGVTTENQFFTAVTKVASGANDWQLQNITKNDSDKVFSSYIKEIGWVEKERIVEERKDYYHSLIEKGELGELKRIHGIRSYWQSVKGIKSKLNLPTIQRARTVWKARKQQKEYWAKK